MMEETSNNLCNVYLEGRPRRRIYQVRWKAVVILLRLSKKSETALPRYIIQEEQQLIQQLRPTPVLQKPMILVQGKMKIVPVATKLQRMKSSLQIVRIKPVFNRGPFCRDAGGILLTPFPLLHLNSSDDL